jgi:tetratricopeptide (TPR) repeat protein
MHYNCSDAIVNQRNIGGMATPPFTMDELVMPLVEFSIGIAGNLLASMIYDAALGRYRGFNTAIYEAALATAGHFSKEGKIEFEATSLLAIIEGKSASDIERFRDGDRFIDGDQLAIEFAQVTDIYVEDEAERLPVAKEILSFFIRKLEHILIKSPDTGLAMVMSYIRAIRERSAIDHMEVMDNLSQVQAELSSLPTKLVQRIVSLPISEYVSYDQRLQSLSTECGIPAGDLKSKIDGWLQSVNTPYERGLYYLSKKDHDSAAKLIRTSISAAEKGLADQYASLALALIQSRDNDGATTVLRKALTLNDNDAYAHGLLAWAYVNLRDFDTALSHQLRAVYLDPRDADQLNALGLIYSHQGNADQAKECFKSAQLLDSANSTSLMNLAGLYKDHGESALAIAAFEEVLQRDLHPITRSCALNGFALLHDELGNAEKAEALYLEAIQVNANNPAAYCNLGNLYHEQGKVEEAIAFFSKAITKEPRYDNAHKNLGLAYQGLGKFREAIQSFKRVVQLSPVEALTVNPDYLESYRSMADCHNSLGEFHEAVTYANRALEIDPNFVAAHTAAGVAFQQLGDYAKAEVHYRRSLELAPNHPAGYYNLACVAALRGNTASAIDFLESAAKLHPLILTTAAADRDFAVLVQTKEFKRLEHQYLVNSTGHLLRPIDGSDVMLFEPWRPYQKP